MLQVDNHDAPYVVGEFNCACVGVDSVSAAIGSDLKAVASADKKAGYKLTDLMGAKVLEQLNEIKSSGGFTSVGRKVQKQSFRAPPPMKGDIGRESTPLPARK